jgi:hypothetical protein
LAGGLPRQVRLGLRGLEPGRGGQPPPARCPCAAGSCPGFPRAPFRAPLVLSQWLGLRLRSQFGPFGLCCLLVAPALSAVPWLFRCPVRSYTHILAHVKTEVNRHFGTFSTNFGPFLWAARGQTLHHPRAWFPRTTAPPPIALLALGLFTQPPCAPLHHFRQWRWPPPLPGGWGTVPPYLRPPVQVGNCAGGRCALHLPASATTARGTSPGPASASTTWLGGSCAIPLPGWSSAVLDTSHAPLPDHMRPATP